MINVGTPFLPKRENLAKYIDQIYDNHWLTNNGPLVLELTHRLEKHLGVENLLLVSNGTLALQIAYNALELDGDAITTPFSFVATASSLKWEGINPVFSDIDPKTFCLDPARVERAITPHTSAIVPVHVFGNACDVEAFQAIAERKRLKVIYDGAHAFGVKYKRESLLSWGDATTLSFHATKLFHSAEGGAVVFKEKAAYERAKLLISFGIDKPDSVVQLGINAKMNEFQAAIGLCVLDEIEFIYQQRATIWNTYNRILSRRFSLQERNPNASNNYSYFPILFGSEAELLAARHSLEKFNVNSRRYFFPSLDTLPFLNDGLPCVNSREIARRILCLPLHPGLTEDEVTLITDCLTQTTVG